MTAYVYRLFGADGDLLYIGSTTDPKTRMRDHRYHKPWWPEVARTDMGDPMPVAEARRLEQAAVVAERPRYNRKNGLYTDPHETYRLKAAGAVTSRQGWGTFKA